MIIRRFKYQKAVHLDVSSFFLLNIKESKK